MKFAADRLLANPVVRGGRMLSIQFAQGKNAVCAAIFLILLSGAMLWSKSAAAEGALAIGLPADVAKNGFAYAYHVGEEPPDEARQLAMKTCREPSPDKSATARALCAIVANFHDQCVAVAEDPQAGTPGVGWSIADTLPKAEAGALAKCKATAGPGRQGACIVDHSQCDGTAIHNGHERDTESGRGLSR
jgi:hypothetical protein